MKKLFASEKVSKSKIKKFVIGFLLIALFAYCAFTLVSNYSDISRLNATAKENDTEYSEQVKDNDQIKAILDSENKDEYIEQKAREKGYVKNGETVYYDISSDK